MVISGNEKYRLETAIGKIQKGIFEPNDVETVFNKLRPYSNKFPRILEVGHFLAHSDKRDRGLIVEHLKAMQIALTFQTEHIKSNKSLDLTDKFPLYVKQHMDNQIALLSDKELKTATTLSKTEAAKRIKQLFGLDESAQKAWLQRGVKPEEEKLLHYLLWTFIVRPLFTQDEIVNDLIHALKFNKVSFDEVVIRSLSNEITLCILALIHKKPLIIKGYKTVECMIGVWGREPVPVGHFEKGQNGENNYVEYEKKSLGPLSLYGNAPFENPNSKKEVQLVFEVLTTSLLAETYCDDSMFQFHREGKPEDQHMTIYQHLSFESDLAVNDKFKLIKLPT
jgi:hypothetical protein